jgi:basic amino acid/polyamine antiporter, APA family
METQGMKRRLSLLDAFAIVAGTTIGSGIFIVSSAIASSVRSPALLLLVWIAAFVMSLTGALTIAELAAMMPAAGGQYVFLREAYGRMCAFLFGWTVVGVIHTGSVAAVAIVFAKYLAIVAPMVHSQCHAGPIRVAGEGLVGIGLILLLTGANIRGLQAGRVVQNLFTFVKISALAIIVLFALVIAPNGAAWHANFGSPSAFFGSGRGAVTIVPAFGAAMISALFSLGGWENLIALGSEVRNPGRTLPVALISAAVLVIVLYLLTNLAYLSQLPVLGDPGAASVFERGISGAQSGRVAAATMQVLWGTAGARLTSVLVMVSTAGCLNGLILGGARLMYAMAHDRVFFRIASRLNDASVPSLALLIQALWASMLVLSGDFGDLLNYLGAAGALFGILTIAAVFVMRAKRPAAHRPYRAWGYPYVPAGHMAGSLAILLDLILVKPKYSMFGLLIVASGIPVYFWLGRGADAERPVLPELLDLATEGGATEPGTNTI